MRRWRFLILLLGLAVPASAAAQSQQLSSRLLNQAIEEFNREPRATRKAHPLMPLNYVEYAEIYYGYSFPPRFTRLAKEGDRFRIDTKTLRKRALSIEIVSQRGAELQLKVFTEKRLTQDFLDHVVPLVLQDLFEFGPARQGPYFVGNSESHVLHLATCNHTPLPEFRVGFETVEAGEAQEYAKCGICFSSEERLPIDNYGIIRSDAIERARVYELAFPPLDDPALQTKIQAIGDSIVGHFPLEPRGFKYQFKIVRSEFANAASFPTGFVYVSNRIFSAVEDRAELALVLAHEIAHVELGRFASDMPYPQVPPLDSYWQMLQYRETEADILAILWLWRNDDRPSAVERGAKILRKVEFASDSTPLDDALAKYATHPSFAARYGFCDPVLFHPSASKESFCGVSEDGATIAQARLVAKRLRQVTTGFGAGEWRIDRVYLLVQTTDLLNEPVALDKGVLIDATGQKFTLDRRRASAERFGPESAMVIEMSLAGTVEKFDDSSIRQINFLGMGTEKWVTCSE